MPVDEGKGEIINGKYYTPDELVEMGLRTAGFRWWRRP
jgi:hypothetical protein